MKNQRDIVCVAEADFDTTTWLNVQPLMSRFAQAGHRVLYIESLGLRVPNLGHAADLKKIARRVRRLFEGMRERMPNLWLLAPRVLPGHHVPFIRWLNTKLLRAQVRSAMRHLKMTSPLLWVYLPTGESLAGGLGENFLLYHCVDDYLANPGVPVEALKKMEDDLTEKADAVMVTAPRLLDKFRSRAKNLTCIPNGADTSAFSYTKEEPADLRSIPHPRIGFSGNITAYKMDFPLLDAVIRAKPDYHFVFIGQLGGGDPSTPKPDFLNLPNVHWLGEKVYAELPPYLMYWDAGIIPYRQSPATDAVFPIKFFEYLAAGLPVVGTPLPSLSDYPEYFLAAQDAVTFAAALDKALSSSKAQVEERKKLAVRNSWDARVQEIASYLDKAMTQASL